MTQNLDGRTGGRTNFVPKVCPGPKVRPDQKVRFGQKVRLLSGEITGDIDFLRWRIVGKK